MAYDSAADTINHIGSVRAKLGKVIRNLNERADRHDRSKLESPEKPIFDRYTPKLKGTTYGSDEYKQYLIEMKVGLDHHYAHNSHHPEHYADGIDGMSLLDVIEMLCDWKAATARHADGDMRQSLLLNARRFGIGDQLARILSNTAYELGWIEDDSQVHD